MKRGKIITEPNTLYIRPTTSASGHSDYMLEGQKVVLELEVVSKELKSKGSMALIDLECLMFDQKISGVFKLNSFVLAGEPMVRLSPKSNINVAKGKSSKEFDQWVEDGHLPLNKRFSRSERYAHMLSHYPYLKETTTLIRFFKWLEFGNYFW